MNNFIIVQGKSVALESELQTELNALRKAALHIARRYWRIGRKEYLVRYHNPDWATCMKRGWKEAKDEAEKKRISTLKAAMPKLTEEELENQRRRRNAREEEYNRRTGTSYWA